MTQIFKTRYQAEKAKKTDPFFSSDSKIVKVDGGYVIMTYSEYKIWKGQR